MIEMVASVDHYKLVLTFMLFVHCW